MLSMAQPETSHTDLFDALYRRLRDDITSSVTANVLQGLQESTMLGNTQKAEYSEPGPWGPRKFFTRNELAQRWHAGESSIRTIMTDELPVWYRGGSARYFWAFVWAYEGRLSYEHARLLWEREHIVQEALSAPEPVRPIHKLTNS